MIDLQLCDGLGLAIVTQWNRWLLGVSYETQEPNVRSVVFYLGPIRLHFIAS